MSAARMVIAEMDMKMRNAFNEPAKYKRHCPDTDTDTDIETETDLCLCLLTCGNKKICL